MVFRSDQQRRRSKSEKRRLPKWLRSPRLLRLAFTVGPFIFRVVRWVLEVLKESDG